MSGRNDKSLGYLNVSLTDADNGGAAAKRTQKATFRPSFLFPNFVGVDAP